MNVINKWKNYRPYLWALFLLSAVAYFFITAKIEMPYDKWLGEHLPVWIAVLIHILLGVCFVILAIPTRSVRLNYIVGSIAAVSIIFLKASHAKAPFLNSGIILVAATFFIMIKLFYRNRT